MLRLRSLVIFLVIGTMVPNAFAQSSARRDSLKQAIADHRSQLHLADSIGEPKASITARLELAPLVSTAERIRLLEDAAAGAQSAALLSEEILVRKQLAEAFAHAGKHARAFEEAMHVTVLDEARLSEQVMRTMAHEDSARTAAKADRDSLERSWQLALQKARHSESHMEATAERWMFIALGIGAAWMLAMVFVLVRMRSQQKRTSTEIAALRAEVAALQVPKNRMREPVVPAPSSPSPIVDVPITTTAQAPPAFDETVLSIFRRRAPERLATLRDARARGDHEKVMRVVHTLKPQLLALDETGSSLCRRIVADKAQQDPQRWNADLDLLEGSIERLLT